MRLQPNGNLGQVFLRRLRVDAARAPNGVRPRALRHHRQHAGVRAGTYTHNEVETRGGYPPAITVWSAPIPNDGARTIPAALQTLLASRFTPDPDGAGPLLPARQESAASQPWVLFRVLDFLPGPVQRRTWPTPIRSWPASRAACRTATGRGKPTCRRVKPAVTNINDNLPSLQRYQSLVAQPNFGVGTFVAGRNYVQSCTTVCRSQDHGSIAELSRLDRHARPTQSDLSQDIVEANLQARSRT